MRETASGARGGGGVGFSVVHHAAAPSQNTGNYSQMLIQAQEQKALATKLLNLKPRVDNKEPKKYTHLLQGRGSAEAARQRQIDLENSMLLKKMLNIIKRKSHYVGGKEQSVNALAETFGSLQANMVD